jgi:hypothetical protein
MMNFRMVEVLKFKQGEQTGNIEVDDEIRVTGEDFELVGKVTDVNLHEIELDVKGFGEYVGVNLTEIKEIYVFESGRL